MSVVGLGKLGAPLAACFARKGFPTIGVDTDPSAVQAIGAGRAVFREPRLQEVLEGSVGRLTATVDHERAVAESDVTFVVVPTPTDDTGAFSLRDVTLALTALGPAIGRKAGFHLVVLVSTVMPGAISQTLKPLLEACSGKTCGRDFGLCYSPEFIALGSVIHDLLHPDFILIGESDPDSGRLLADLYGRFCENVPPVARMNFTNAELTKLAVNAYLTTKISFANMLARFCERLPETDVDVVTAAIGLDARIGGKYLTGAVSYGGPCFPRDNVAFAALARMVGAPSLLADSTDAFNRQQLRWLADLVKRRLPRDGTVGILGLAYKPNCELVDESVGLALATVLVSDNIRVTAYDPAAMENAHKISCSIAFAASAVDCIRQADVVVVATPWPEFKDLSAAVLGDLQKPRVIIDSWRVLGHLRHCPGLVYLPLGIGPQASRSAL